MGFKVYVPKTITFNPLEEGYVALCAAGNARFHREDLALVGIEGAATVLTDELTLRIALRKPRPNETGKTMLVTSPKEGTAAERTRAHVRLAGALRELRLDPKAAKGRYELTTKDDLLIINLAGCKAGEKDDEEDDGGDGPADKQEDEHRPVRKG